MMDDGACHAFDKLSLTILLFQTTFVVAKRLLLFPHFVQYHHEFDLSKVDSVLSSFSMQTYEIRNCKKLRCYSNYINIEHDVC